MVDEAVELFGAPPPPAENTLKSVLDRSRAELLYLWSRRWLEAQREEAPGTKADEVAAIEGHLGRMKNLEKGCIFEALSKKYPMRSNALTEEQLADALRDIPEFQTSIKFYRMEAESWLAKAKSR